MSKVTCTRRLQWCMGHRVHGHENKCGHLHGHNYVGFFTAFAPKLDDKGRVVDFSVLKEKIGGFIDHFWDHGMVLQEDDPAAKLMLNVPDIPEGKRQKLYLMKTNPTAENLAKHLLEDVFPDLFEGTDISIVRIKLYETENSIAEVEDAAVPTVPYDMSFLDKKTEDHG